MPAPVQDLFVAPTTAPITISLEPALNAVHSLALLAKSADMSGFGDWVADTTAAMSAPDIERHRLVMIGFYFAIVPQKSWPSFPAYLDHLASLPASALRDKLLDAYISLPCSDGTIDEFTVDRVAILDTVDTYLEFLSQRFTPEHIEVDLETKAYDYILDPPALQQLIVSHLRNMWDDYLAAEWERVRPMLLDAVYAFEQVDYGKMDKVEIAEFITGQSMTGGHLETMLDKAEHLLFVPSAHAGPYLGKFKVGEAFAILFGARLPEGVQYDAPDLSRAEILVRLTALADDTRLRILKFLAEDGEQRSQDIMRHLDLSQSAASRHLKQLSATGHLTERRCEGAKCYSLNNERIEDTLDAVKVFLAES